MESYTDFAYVYDMFMDDVPYERWADRIAALLEKYDERVVPAGDESLRSEAGLLLDIGCGTGTLTRLMRERGYDPIGVDASDAMLGIAIEHEADEDPDRRILYLNQDMRELELYSTVGAAISICDCINYLTDPGDVRDVFKLVNNYLYPRGLFIFDFNTVHYYRDELGDDVIAENRPGGSFIWENYYDEETRINEYDLTLYRLVRDGEDACGSADPMDDAAEPGTGPYVRSSETHIVRGYEYDEILRMLEEAGLEYVTGFDSDTDGEVTDETCRICIVARESGKQTH